MTAGTEKFLLTAQNSLQAMQTMKQVKTSLNGQSKIMASEIELDKGRGVDTRKKEATLEKMEERLLYIDGSISERMSALSKETAENREEETNLQNESNKAAPPEEAATAEISPEARAAAEAEGMGTPNTAEALPPAEVQPPERQVLDEKV